MGTIVVIIIVLAVVIGLIVSPSFRTGVQTQIQSLMTAVFDIAEIYAFIAGLVLLAGIIFVALALMIGDPIFSGIIFLVVISLFFVVWLPLGAVLKIFKTNPAVVPVSVKSFFAWLAFVGFLAVMTPDVFSMKSALIASLLAIFFVMIPSKINFLEKVIMPLVLIMCLVNGWKWIAPDSFRAFDRHRNAVGGLVTTTNDRWSMREEASAASTFAKLISDVKVVYTAKMTGDNISALTANLVSLKKDTVMLLCNQKKELSIFEGQAFVQVRLANNLGSFVGGQCYWIEANLVEIGTLSALLRPKQFGRAVVTPPVTLRTVSFGPGTHSLALLPGETIRLITKPSQDGCRLLAMSSPTFAYQYKFDSKSWEQDSPSAVYPYMRNPTCLLNSQTGDTLTVVVK